MLAEGYFSLEFRAVDLVLTRPVVRDEYCDCVLRKQTQQQNETKQKTKWPTEKQSKHANVLKQADPNICSVRDNKQKKKTTTKEKMPHFKIRPRQQNKTKPQKESKWKNKKIS